jgi:hypothetical protein
MRAFRLARRRLWLARSRLRCNPVCVDLGLAGAYGGWGYAPTDTVMVPGYAAYYAYLVKRQVWTNYGWRGADRSLRLLKQAQVKQTASVRSF